MRVCPGCRTTYEEHITTCPKDGLPLIERSPTFAALKPGEVPEEERDRDTKVRVGLMIGEYQVEGVIAEGGMGVIYAGIHPLIRKKVAVKVLSKRFAQDPKAVSRFVLEARSVNEIGHHNIVDIFSIGELDDQRNYLIMEFLDGLPLHEILMKVQRLKPAEVLPIYEQLCDALRAAHEKGFVHRDLKPDNVVVLRRPPYPFIKILDFGLAKLRGSVSSKNTEVGTVLGTPEYMAPEQCRGDQVDARTDVYALGVMLYELLTGRRPFTDPSPFRVLAMQQRETPKPPSRYAPIPSALEWVVLKAMAKHPNQRFGSVGELLQQLQRAVPERVPWNINLDPLPEMPAEPKPGVEQLEPIPTVRPPKPRDIAVPEPVAISGEMMDEDIETLVADSRPGVEPSSDMLKLLRKEEHAQEIRGEDPDRIAVPSVRNVRLAPAEARAPAPLLGTPDSGELEDMGATEVTEPPEGAKTDVGVSTTTPDTDVSVAATTPDTSPDAAKTEEVPALTPQKTEAYPPAPAQAAKEPAAPRPAQPGAPAPTDEKGPRPAQPAPGAPVPGKLVRVRVPSTPPRPAPEHWTGPVPKQSGAKPPAGPAPAKPQPRAPKPAGPAPRRPRAVPAQDPGSRRSGAVPALTDPDSRRSGAVPALDPPRSATAAEAPGAPEPPKPAPPKKPEGLPLFPDNREAIEAEVEHELAKALGDLTEEVEIEVDDAAARGAPDSGEVLVDVPPVELRRQSQEVPVGKVSSGVYTVEGLGGPGEQPAEEAKPIVDEPPKEAGIPGATAEPSRPPSELADLIERDTAGEGAKAGTNLVFETVEGAEGAATPLTTPKKQQPRQAHWSPDGANALPSARAGLSRRNLLLIGAGVAILVAGGVALLVHLL